MSITSDTFNDTTITEPRRFLRTIPLSQWSPTVQVAEGAVALAAVWDSNAGTPAVVVLEPAPAAVTTWTFRLVHDGAVLSPPDATYIGTVEQPAQGAQPGLVVGGYAVRFHVLRVER